MSTSRGTTRPWAAVCAALALSAWSSGASAQAVGNADSVRSVPWQTVTSVTAVSAMATQVLMPRLFYSDPETTVGWKARFHVSVLAPTLTLTALTLLNEYALKSAIGAKRPGCGDSEPTPCGDPDPYETMSSHSFAAFSAFGQGTAVFLVDTMKWSDGKLNAGSIAGNVALPLVLAVVTAAGRIAGNWEDADSVILSSGVGLVIGVLTGVTYAMMARPECGYTGDLICW
jgi:hypothetical protein